MIIAITLGSTVLLLTHSPLTEEIFESNPFNYNFLPLDLMTSPTIYLQLCSQEIHCATHIEWKQRLKEIFTFVCIGRSWVRGYPRLISHPLQRIKFFSISPSFWKSRKIVSRDTSSLRVGSPPTENLRSTPSRCLDSLQHTLEN